jgi:AcrR family transcriptional regulator
MTVRPSGLPKAWIATAFTLISSSGHPPGDPGASCAATLTDAGVRLAKVRDVADHLPQALRCDAAGNRERILDAARALFAAKGLSVPVREIARSAGVGPATVYRHFPTKEMLASAAFSDQLHACHAIIDEGLAESDPWRGFSLVIEKICELHARNWGFTAAFRSAFPHAMDFAADRDYSLRSIARLAGRAQETGRLRPDFVVDDLVLVIMANNGIYATSPAARVAASRRFAALAIQAFQAVPKPATAG